MRQNNEIKYFLILGCLVAFMPIIQMIFKPFKLIGLDGAFTIQEKPKFSWETFLNGSYQQQTDDYLKDNTAFRGDLVRLRNQINYALFGDINTILTLGKENYLFDPNYIFAREGTDLLHDSIFAKNKILIENGCAKLKKLNIPIIFCIAPNKANFYSEFIPYPSKSGIKTNQKLFDSLLKTNNITTLNFDQLFINLKNDSKYPLIPKYGAHWSIYGASIAADSLLSSLNTTTKKRFIKMGTSKIELSEKAKYTDDDLLGSLNLIWKWKSPKMAYPVLNLNIENKPNLLIVSDSYFWSFYELGIVQNCFSPNSRMWYYNKSVYDINREKINDRNDKISYNDLKGRDAIIIMATAPSLKDFAYGFFTQLNNLKIP